MHVELVLHLVLENPVLLSDATLLSFIGSIYNSVQWCMVQNIAMTFNCVQNDSFN